MIKESTATRLKKIMNERNLKQADIIRKCEPISNKYYFGDGKKVKITKSDLSQWISGKYEPGQWKLTILSEALNVNPAWLMGFDVPKYKNEIQKEKIENNDDGIYIQKADGTTVFLKNASETDKALMELPEEQKKAILSLIGKRMDEIDKQLGDK